MRTIYAIMATVGIMLVFYGLAAFVTWEINPGKWDIAARFMAGFCGIAFGCMSGAYIIIEAD